jgi:hypothetical protein
VEVIIEDNPYPLDEPLIVDRHEESDISDESLIEDSSDCLDGD